MPTFKENHFALRPRDLEAREEITHGAFYLSREGRGAMNAGFRLYDNYFYKSSGVSGRRLGEYRNDLDAARSEVGMSSVRNVLREFSGDKSKSDAFLWYQIASGYLFLLKTW